MSVYFFISYSYNLFLVCIQNGEYGHAAAKVLLKSSDKYINGDMMVNKTAIYTRVSKSEQNQEMQKKITIEYCKHNRIEVYDVYQDVISGKKESRPAFDRLLYDMRHRRFNAIAVTRLDRIGRSLQHLLQLFQEFKNRDIKFISVTQNIDTSTPEGELMLRVLMLLADYERTLIVARTCDTLNCYKDDIEKYGYFVSRDGKRISKLGRPKTSKDKKKRKKSGYYRRWERESTKKSTPVVLTDI